MTGIFNIIACGVGGQGVVLVSNVVGEACARSGLKVVTGEMHGLSQRSGSVIVHQRIGENALSPLVPYGEADVILALEPMEALRYLFYIKPGGFVITNTNIVHPPNETEDIIMKKKNEYVKYDAVIAAIKEAGARIIEINALELAHEAGNALTENVVLVGALSAVTDFPVDQEILLNAVRSTVPERAIKINESAFTKGHDAYNTFHKGD